MELIEPDELRRYLDTLARWSYSADDFELFEQDLTDPKSDELCPLKGCVRVHRKSNDAAADYPIGDACSWVENFDRDLGAGRFG